MNYTETKRKVLTMHDARTGYWLKIAEASNDPHINLLLKHREEMFNYGGSTVFVVREIIRILNELEVKNRLAKAEEIQ